MTPVIGSAPSKTTDHVPDPLGGKFLVVVRASVGLHLIDRRGTEQCLGAGHDRQHDARLKNDAERHRFENGRREEMDFAPQVVGHIHILHWQLQHRCCNRRDHDSNQRCGNQLQPR